ncbi:hypothetical protein PVAND_006135 [Polypedilum vanderplanki]|uniref:Uncharacterized protein n=1 Tax=Polypedilum vanderplanki TaxID=319348 RepID=A0A9J6C2N0_POLVA|nr:hypothetical protein PVAND_006135 [Polypedilum vanderplanki]
MLEKIHNQCNIKINQKLKFLITDNYRTIATDLCALAKSQGSRDNISVIVVYLKEPELIATQSWPSEITQNKDIMENLNLYESEQVAPSQQQPAIVSLDALGNTNQDIFNNPFGDFNNQLISNVTMAKSTDITDMVMQQQPENEFCNLTDTLTSNLNNINNNKITNGSHADEIFNAIDDGEQQQQQQQPSQSDSNVLILNDDNNNSNDNFNNPDMGPETDVDAIEDDEDFHYHAGSNEIATGGEKEKTQMEFKETDDVTDHMQMNFGSEIATDNAMIVGNSSLENKIFEELSLHNPDMMMSGGINPFAGNEFIDNSTAEIITDNKLMEEQIDEMQQELKQEIEHGANDFIENVEHEIDFVTHEQETAPLDAATFEASGFASELEQELISANDEMNEEVAIQEEKEQQQQPLMSGELRI